MDINKIYLGDCLHVLKTLPDKSINTCVTSPPYYGLRDYGTGIWVGGDPSCPHYRISKRSDTTSTGHANMVDSGHPVGDAIYKTICPICGAIRVDNQIGLEESPEQYINKLVEIFREVKRVLRDDGSLWVNIGDSYNSKPTGSVPDGSKQLTNVGSLANTYIKKLWNGAKAKDLIGIPWMFAFALRNDGWYLRQDIIWSKPNPMPESVKDRCTKSHEYIFLFSKSPKYYFDYDAIKEPAVTFDYNVRDRDSSKLNNTPGRTRMGGLTTNQYIMRHKRIVWSVRPAHYSEAHFATYPEELIYPCILAGCPKDGIVLDPFMGSGTTAVVAKRNHRNYVGIELNSEYKEMAERRIKGTLRKLF